MGLHNVTSVGGDIDIKGNDLLTNLTGLENLTSVEGNIIIGTSDGNPLLNDLTGLNSLTSVGNTLEVRENNALTSLNGLEMLSFIGGNLHIGYKSLYGGGSGNAALASLASLNSLQTVNGNVNISFNNSLTNLSGLDSIDAGSINNLTIWSNESLSECDVQSVCEYIANPGGSILIGLNAMGCFYLPQVQEACLTGINEFSAGKEITLSPNPASSFITMTTPQNQPIEGVIIYNHFGQKVLSDKPLNNTVDVSTLKPGIYCIEVVTKDWRGRTKIVKK